MLERSLKRKLVDEKRASRITPVSKELDQAMVEITEKILVGKKNQEKDETARKLADIERETAEDVRRRSMDRLGQTQKRDDPESKEKRKMEYSV